MPKQAMKPCFVARASDVSNIGPGEHMSSECGCCFRELRISGEPMHQLNPNSRIQELCVLATVAA